MSVDHLIFEAAAARAIRRHVGHLLPAPGNGGREFLADEAAALAQTLADIAGDYTADLSARLVAELLA